MNSFWENPAAFAKAADLDPGGVSTVLNNKRQMPDAWIKKLHSLQPDIDINWLLSGEGEMLKSGFGPKKYKPPEPYRFPYLISNLIHLRQVGLLAADNLPSDDIQTSLIHIEEGRIAPTLDMLLFIREHAGIGIDDLLFIDLSTEENMKQAIETVATLKKVREHQRESEEIREALKTMQKMLEEMQERLKKVEDK